MTDRAIIWEPAAGIDGPCTAIAFRYDPPDKLLARMFFSRVKGGPDRDLEVLFPDRRGWRPTRVCPEPNCVSISR
jgi:hypothetical protein